MNHGKALTLLCQVVAASTWASYTSLPWVGNPWQEIAETSVNLTDFGRGESKPQKARPYEIAFSGSSDAASLVIGDIELDGLPAIEVGEGHATDYPVDLAK